MQIVVSNENNITLLTFDGRLDTQTAPEAQTLLTEAIAGEGKRVVIDFDQLDYISSAGLRILLIAAKQLKASQGEIRICNLNQVVQEVFDISGFSSIFQVFGSKADALRSF